MTNVTKNFTHSAAMANTGIPQSGRIGARPCRLWLKLLAVIGVVVVCGSGWAIAETGLVSGQRRVHEYWTFQAVAPEALPRPTLRYVNAIQETGSEWHQPGASNVVTDRDLRRHSYAMFVGANGTCGSCSQSLAARLYTLLPSLYEAQWFIVFSLLLLVGLFWAAHQWRVRQLHHQFEITLDARVCERTRIARELHDTVLQSFHGALLQFQIVSESLPERPLQAKEQLDHAIDQAADAITQGREVVQGLRDSTLEGDNLVMALSTFAQELLTAATRHDSADFQLTVEGTPQTLRSIVRDEIYKVAAEALRNVFRHAEAERVEVEIRYGKEEFRLRVRDDGKGINPAILVRQNGQGHYGLDGMRERATLIGGKLSVWSEIDAGTEVELRVPAVAAFAPTRRDSWFTRSLVALGR
jgi:signal transduction histidine kinase